jgi:hypothetical protein
MSQMVEPPDGGDGEILPEFLELYAHLTSGLILTEEAHDYVLGFLAHGTQQVRERERALGIVQDTQYRDRARATLADAAREVTQQLGSHASETVTREHLETLFPQMCTTGYPPFCYGPGPSAPEVSGGTFSPGFGAQVPGLGVGWGHEQERELAGEPS